MGIGASPPVRRWAPALLLLLLLAFAAPAQAQDEDGDGTADQMEADLLEAHAPYFYFHPDETYFPVAVDFALEHSVLERFNGSGPPILVDADPTPVELAAFSTPANPEVNPGDVVYLNNTRGSVRDDAGILSAYRAADAEVVYGRATTTNGERVLQYWLFYAFNPGRWNHHEGDWEMVQVTLQGGNPVHVAYSQHQHGQRLAWANVLTEGTHPKVFVARGSHANYPRPYQGQLGIAGDEVSDAGPVWSPTDYEVANVGEAGSPLPGMEWLGFAGLWGEFYLQAYARAEVGPSGPAFRAGGEMFGSPVAWAEDLSVPTRIDLGIEWILANIWLVFFGLLGLSILLTLLRLWRVQRRTKAGVRMWPYAHLRPVDRKSVGLLLAVAGLALGVVGFFYPWYVVTLEVDAPGFLVTEGAVDFLRVGGVDGVLVNPLRAGGAGDLVALVPLPLAFMFVILTGYYFVRIAGTKTARRLGAKFLGRGIVWLLPFALIVLFTSTLLVGLAGLDLGGIRPDLILEPVAEDPFGGSTSLAYEGGSAEVAWGLAFGSYLLFGAAGLMVLAALLCFSERYFFLPRVE